MYLLYAVFSMLSRISYSRYVMKASCLVRLLKHPHSTTSPPPIPPSPLFPTSSPLFPTPSPNISVCSYHCHLINSQGRQYCMYMLISPVSADGGKGGGVRYHLGNRRGSVDRKTFRMVQWARKVWRAESTVWCVAVSPPIPPPLYTF